MECRSGCGACCIAPSITSPLPGMLNGKPAGARCVQLDQENICKVFGDKQRPDFCSGLQPAVDMCGTSREHALSWLTQMEQVTMPQV